MPPPTSAGQPSHPTDAAGPSAAGFPPEAIEFYRALEANNNRDWWLANKQTYVDAVRTPMELLADGLAAEFGDAKVFRPQRDLRFSADKTPYKTHQGAVVHRGSGIGWYVQLDGVGLMTAAGMFRPQPDQVRRYRSAVLNDVEGRRLASELTCLLVSSDFTLTGDLMKTQPRGVAFAHPRYELVRQKTLVMRCHHGPADWLGTPEVLDRVRADWRAFDALVSWFDRNVGTTERPRR